MLFNSIEFLFIFLPGILAAYYLARRYLSHLAALFVLNVGSLVFYAWWDVDNLPLLIGSVVVNHLIGRAMARGRAQPFLALGIIFNLALLGFFKYADFLIVNIDRATPLEIEPLGLSLPLAISFFTFQQISFLVDIARGRTKPGHIFSHMLFVSFFPHIVAGPIVQHHQIAAQFADKTRKDDLWENLGVGLTIFAVGLAKKVLIAENIEPFASSVFAGAERGDAPGLILAWVGASAYALQIYFDFSGYSDMALGLGRSLGYRLPVNFNGPYKSASVVEFWRRWHITLSHFLRDHLYIPLGGNRRGEGRRAVNLMATMLLGGLWHGAAWTFVVWGGLHGAALMINHYWARFGPRGWFDGRRRAFAVVLTFAFTTIAWVFFRAESWGGAGLMLGGMFGANGLGAPAPGAALAWVCFGLLMVWSLPDTPEIFCDVIDDKTLEDAGIKRTARLRWKFTRWAAAGAAAALFFSVLNAWKTSEFIYYAF